MISLPTFLKVTAVMTLALTVSARGVEAPKRIDVGQLSKKVDDVVVPLPNEVFGALNKLGGVNWKEYVRNSKGSNFTERPRIALLLGTVIADGFIAVQAEDAATVKEIGQRVLGLSKGIGVGQFDHAAREGDHGSGGQAELAGRPPGARSDAETASSRR
jgi:hypothetical protein